MHLSIMEGIPNFKQHKLTGGLRISVLAILLYVCTSHTELTGSCKPPEATHTYKNVVVAGLTEKLLARREVDKDMQNQLLQHGIKATKSIEPDP